MTYKYYCQNTKRHKSHNYDLYFAVVPYEGYSDLIVSLQAVALRHRVKMTEVKEPHISLTRTVVLMHHWILEVVSSVKIKFKRLRR